MNPIRVSLALVVCVLPAFGQRRAALQPPAPLPSPKTYFVDAGATGGNNGRSFLHAFTDLQSALAVAVGRDRILIAGGTYLPDGGTGNQNLRFDIPSDVHLIGGFAGNAGPAPMQRDPALYPTILSGDLAGDDQPGFLNRSDNSTGIAWIGFSTTNHQGRIRGITFRGSEGSPAAYAFESAVFHACRFEDNRAVYRGGGLLAVEEVAVFDSVFTGNEVSFAAQNAGGGGMAVDSLTGGLTAVLVRTEFTGNKVTPSTAGSFQKYGGGFYFDSVTPAEDLTIMSDCKFDSNELNGPGRAQGGGAHVESKSEILRTDFLANLIDNGEGLNCFGGGLSSGSGTAFGGASDLARIVSCRFLGNKVEADLGTTAAFFIDLRGGGAYVDGGEAQNCVFAGNRVTLLNDGGTFGRTVIGSGLYGRVLTVRNSTVANNSLTATGSAGQFGEDTGGGFSSGFSSSIYNSILWNNVAEGATGEDAQVYLFAGSLLVHHTDVQGWTGALGGTGNFGANPLFVDARGPDLLFGTDDDDYRLGATSPCLDVGDNLQVGTDALDLDKDGDRGEALPLDLDGENRIRAGTGTETHIVDLGPYEG
jgi:hypothetical protein